MISIAQDLYTDAQRWLSQFLRKVKADFGSLSLEHMRDAPADDSRAYLHSINGLGSKSVACIMLLALGKPEFPVDTNVGRIMVRTLVSAAAKRVIVSLALRL